MIESLQHCMDLYDAGLISKREAGDYIKFDLQACECPRRIEKLFKLLHSL